MCEEPCHTEKGYVRYRFNRDGRVMEHVAVARIAWGPRVPWPQGMDVHHQDGKRDHNCRCNLLILPEALHCVSNGTTRQRARYEA